MTSTTSDDLDGLDELRAEYEEARHRWRLELEAALAAAEDASRKRVEQARREHDEDLRVLREEQDELDQRAREEAQARDLRLEEECQAHQLTRERLESKETEIEQRRSELERCREELEALKRSHAEEIETMTSRQFFRAAAFAKAYQQARGPEADAEAEKRLEELIREFVVEYST